MQRLPSRGKSSKPPPLQSRDSVTQYETGVYSISPLIEQSKAVLEGPLPLGKDGHDGVTTTAEAHRVDSDVFETPVDDESNDESDEENISVFGSGYEELPIEIQSLMERFLESLALKVHPAPLSTARLAELYQDFYTHAYAQISTHIAALSIKISREASPTPSMSSGRSVSSLVAGKRKPPDRRLSRRTTSDQQMLTASEVTGRRKARRQLETKRLAMEEAVERGVCEKVYPRIWRHGSTDDEAQDEKLRSRAAALELVGVNLKELLSSAMSDNMHVTTELENGSDSDENMCRNRLVNARESLASMNTDRYPLGKLNHLTMAHKHIVEALQDMFPSVSSADEVLPTLIYAIITMPPESISVVSNLNFIQRFRASSKIDGEAAYCLTNLEAAISFLENVDLSSIRSSEVPEGPMKTSSPLSTPRHEKPDPLYRGLPSSPPMEANVNSSPAPKSPSASGNRHRRISSLRPLEAASGAVISGADNIQSALDGGFKFLFGKLRERQATSTPHGSPVPSAPKTLEDAKKIVSPELPGDETPAIERSNTDGPTPEEEQRGMAMADKALELILGKTSQTSRDRSVDSSKSGNSIGKKPSSSDTPVTAASKPPLLHSPASHTGYNAVESMRNLGNSLNPMRGFGGLSLRGFGRPASTSNPGQPPNPATLQIPTASASGSSSPAPALATPITPVLHGGETGTGSATHTTFDFRSIGPPIPRYVECKDARELTFYDVELLLRDYQRLAGAVRAAAEIS